MCNTRVVMWSHDMHTCYDDVANKLLEDIRIVLQGSKLPTTLVVIVLHHQLMIFTLATTTISTNNNTLILHETSHSFYP